MQEILNPSNPISEKLELFIHNYLKLCLSDVERIRLAERFNGILELLNELVQAKTGAGLDLGIQMAAAFVAGKFKMKFSDVDAGMAVAESMIRGQLNRVRRAGR